MTFGDLFVSYFTSTPTGAALLSVLLLGVSLLVSLRLARDNARYRSRIFVGLFVLVIFAWSFVALSFLFCGAFLRVYETSGDIAIRDVFGLSLSTSIAVAFPISLLVASRAPRLLFARLRRELLEPDGDARTTLQQVASKLGVDGVKLWKLSSESPVACTFGGHESSIVISDALAVLLEQDEMEAVLAHELAHVKAHDSNISILFSVYRKVLFFDPVLRAIEARFHREREFAADEVSAFFTRKPLSLASALLKISQHQGVGLRSPAAVPVVGLGWHRREPELKERILRLIGIAERLQAAG